MRRQDMFVANAARCQVMKYCGVGGLYCDAWSQFVTIYWTLFQFCS